MGAQAIVRPMPQIPDELRQEAFNAIAVARFHIAADGTAMFELVKPTPNPRLNRLLLERLKEWRFFPAMRDGKPVPSDQDVRITFEVK
jgi:protein TonB